MGEGPEKYNAETQRTLGRRRRTYGDEIFEGVTERECSGMRQSGERRVGASDHGCH